LSLRGRWRIAETPGYDMAVVGAYILFGDSGGGVGRFGGVVGPFLAGILLSLHWSIPAVFYASAVPALCGCAGAFLLGWRATRSPEMRYAQAGAAPSYGTPSPSGS
jgi:hypothetical protein